MWESQSMWRFVALKTLNLLTFFLKIYSLNCFNRINDTCFKIHHILVYSFWFVGKLVWRHSINSQLQLQLVVVPLKSLRIKLLVRKFSARPNQIMSVINILLHQYRSIDRYMNWHHKSNASIPLRYHSICEVFLSTDAKKKTENWKKTVWSIQMRAADAWNTCLIHKWCLSKNK